MTRQLGRKRVNGEFRAKVNFSYWVLQIKLFWEEGTLKGHNSCYLQESFTAAWKPPSCCQGLSILANCYSSFYTNWKCTEFSPYLNTRIIVRPDLCLSKSCPVLKSGRRCFGSYPQCCYLPQAIKFPLLQSGLFEFYELVTKTRTTCVWLQKFFQS